MTAQQKVMIDSAIDKAAEEENFQGVISLREEGEVLYEKAFGLRDISNGLPHRTDTAFGLASGTKSFTAAAVATLIDRGKLQFDTRIKDIFGKRFTFIDPKATMEDLLGHTSGIYDYYDEEIITDFDNFSVALPWYRLETPTDYLPLFENHPPKFQRGERFSYSNGGYVMLGLIIEEVSGMLYRHYMNSYVLKPAKMASSGFFAFNDLPANTALGYMQREGRLVSNIYQLPLRGGGDGGMYSTAEDVARFWEALLKGTLLRRETTARLLSPQPLKENYACGFYLPGPREEGYVKMSGCDVGVGFVSRCDRRRDNILTVISNRTGGTGAVYSRVRKLID